VVSFEEFTSEPTEAHIVSTGTSEAPANTSTYSAATYSDAVVEETDEVDAEGEAAEGEVTDEAEVAEEG
jgi:hypothetical protein